MYLSIQVVIPRIISSTFEFRIISFTLLLRLTGIISRRVKRVGNGPFGGMQQMRSQLLELLVNIVKTPEIIVTLI
jgi:hypothetical protein